MLVKQANINFAHEYSSSKLFQTTEKLVARSPDGGDQTASRDTVLISAEQSVSTVLSRQDISQTALRGRQMASDFINDSDTMGNQVDNNQNKLIGRTDEDDVLDAETSQLKMLVENLLIGKKINLSEVSSKPEGNENIDKQAASSLPSPTEQGIQSSETSSLIYQLQERYEERESSYFSVEGNIELESGVKFEVDFSQFNLREYVTEQTLEVKVGEVELVDPLVVNLSTPSAMLSNEKYDFDLDNDGQAESISFAVGQSGFLALDKNKNGAIDNGTELFGALTGDGFAELSKYDQDGNQFIDSGDAVFKDLLFYQKNSSGRDSLTSLNELSIGALYLGNQSTPFDLKDEENKLQARVRTSGIYLNENGTVGSLQQIDLAV